MDAPTPAEVRARSKFLTDEFPDSLVPDPLETWVPDAAAIVSAITCRDIGSGAGEEVPPNLVPIAIKAVALKTEYFALADNAKSTKSKFGAAGLRSFSAGSYSESYFDPTITLEAHLLDINPELNDLLWLLITGECKANKLAELKGENEPAAAIQSFDYKFYGGGY